VAGVSRRRKSSQVSASHVDAQKKIFADFEQRMVDQAIALNLGNYGLFQIASTKLKNFKAYRIPRMWGVWLE
jgi:peptide/nickel transport system substrate-binding protein